MAWVACTQDRFITWNSNATENSAFSFSARIAYRLFLDDSTEQNDPLVRVDVSYVHVNVKTLSTEASPLGFYNECAMISPFIGNYNTAFNQDQYNLNEELDDNGQYVHTFQWPYYEYVDVNTVQDSFDSLEESLLTAMFNNVCLAGVSWNRSTGTMDESTIRLTGESFSQSSTFEGSNSNGQSKIFYNGETFDASSSSLVQKSTGKVLLYDEEWDIDDSDLTVESPYYDTSALCSYQISQSELEQYGLLKYDPEHFATDGVYDPYIVDAYTVFACKWVFSHRLSSDSTNYLAVVKRDSDYDIHEDEIKYDDFDVPEYPLPDPIKPINDNTVFRLKKQYDSNGNVVTDQNGYPILTWVKCERMGQE